MKKIFISCLLVICVLTGVLCFTACNDPRTEYVFPEISTDYPNITIEHVSNAEKDFEFPIEGLKFEHSLYLNGSLQYGWVLFDENRNIVGWLEDVGSGYLYEDGKYYYGYGPSNNNDVYGYVDEPFTLYLKNYLAKFDKISFTTNHGTIVKAERDDSTGPALLRYNNCLGAENYSYCDFIFKLSDVNYKDVKSIEMKMVVDGSLE